MPFYEKNILLFIKKSLLFCLFGFVCASEFVNIDNELNDNGKRADNNDNSEIRIVSKKNLIVSTLDGKVSLINTHNGNLKWSLKLGDVLLSSSISKLEVNKNGVLTRLIPSLDGNLYQFDGHNVEPLPFNADSLLSSSFKLNPESIIVGGKSAETFGIDVLSGQLKYVCSVNGCKQFGNVSEEDNLGTLVFNRNSKIVRSVEADSGIEKWNFSVGKYEIKFIPGKAVIQDEIDNQSKTEQEIPFKFNFEDVVIPKDENYGNIRNNKVNLKFCVSEGIINGVDKDYKGKILWKQHFDSPIAQIWEFDEKSIFELSIFDAKIIPALSASSMNLEEQNVALRAALYIGVYKEQLYINPSEDMQNIVEKSFAATLPKIKWQPFFDSSPEKTEANLYVKLPKHLPWSTTKIINNGQTTELSIIYNKETNINGYYLFPDKPLKFRKRKFHQKITLVGNQSVIHEVTYTVTSDWRYWIVSGLVTISLIFQILRWYINPKHLIKPTNDILKSHSNFQNSMNNETVFNVDEVNKPKERKCSDSDFSSRYKDDFEHLEILGKGGFGVVFKACNNLDKVNYAIKRICTGSSEETEKKVLREAKALAKLDHPNIVRYYQSWVERPPINWINENGPLNNYDDNDLTETTVSSFYKNYSDTSENVLPVKSYLSESVIGKYKTDDSNDSIVFQDSSSSIVMRSKSDQQKINSWSDRINTNDRIELKRFRSQQLPKHYLFIQMQLCSKENLKDWLDSRKSVDKLVSFDYFYQILSAVEYVHSNGFIHRDLKPSNIFFSKDKQVKVGDFGLAIEDTNLIDLNDFGFQKSSNHTKDVGTKLYMSPEQINGAGYSNKIDIFSLGLLFFELLNHFSTEMERRITLDKLRYLKFPKHFANDNFEEEKLIRQMLNNNPLLRPTANEILESKLFFNLPRLKCRSRLSSSNSSDRSSDT